MLFASLAAFGLATSFPAWSQRLHGFGPVQSYAPYYQFAPQVNAIGDVNADGLDDVIIFYRNSFSGSGQGDVLVRLNTGSAFNAPVKWNDWFSIGDEIPLAGDFNGDGRCDVVTFLRGTLGDVYVALSSGNAFGAGQLWHGGFCFGDEIPLVADINGDGMDDLLTFTRGTTKRVYAALSTGSGFSGSGWLWHGDFCPGDATPAAGDVNGDGRDDILCFYGSTQSGAARGDVMAALSTGSSFGARQKWHDWFSVGSETPRVADVNADGRDDVLTFTGGAAADVYVALSTGSQFSGTGQRWHDRFAEGTKVPEVGRFNGDLNTDLISFRGGSGSGQIEVSLAGGHAIPEEATAEEFGYGTMGVPWSLAPLNERPALTEIPLIVALVDIVGRPAFSTSGRNQAFFDQLFFGPGHPNVREYFLEMSGRRFTFKKVAVVGPIRLDPADAANGDVRSILKQALADGGIDFRIYDDDGNGIIENKELVIAQVDNGTNASGQTTAPPATIAYGNESIQVWSSVAAAGFRGVIDLYAHELAHTISTIDMYSSGCYCQGATLMHCNAGTSTTSLVHLDPYHKMRLGWISPKVYDVRDYPGGTYIDLAQTTGNPGYRPPVLLYDGNRGTHEYYMIDFRNPTWNGGARTSPTGAAAGYDRHVVRRGFGLWYFNTTEHHNFVNRKSALKPGANSVLDTSIWPGSDDLVYSGPPLGFTSDRFYTDNLILPGPDGILDSEPDWVVLPGDNFVIDTPVASGSDDIYFENRIFPGPDGRLQSFPSGNDDQLSVDDRFASDVMAFLSATPADYLSRRTSTFYGKSDGEIVPRWFDRTSIGAGIRFDEGGTTSPTAYVSWGEEFISFLTGPRGLSLPAGSVFAIDGNLGVREEGILLPAITNRDHTYELDIQSWNGTRSLVKIPYTARPGQYRILVYADDSRELASNSLPITVENPYLIWAEEALKQILATNPDLALPFADADLDGWPNIGEFLTDTDPMDSGSYHGLELSRVAGQGLRVQWSERIDRSAFVRAGMQWSDDLHHWSDVQAPVVSQQNGIVTREFWLSGAETEAFVRLVFQSP